MWRVYSRVDYSSENEGERPGRGLRADAFDLLASKVWFTKGLLDCLVSILSNTIGSAIAAFDDGAISGGVSALPAKLSQCRFEIYLVRKVLTQVICPLLNTHAWMNCWSSLTREQSTLLIVSKSSSGTPRHWLKSERKT
jgi:hypothetical protein